MTPLQKRTLVAAYVRMIFAGVIALVILTVLFFVSHESVLLLGAAIDAVLTLVLLVALMFLLRKHT